MDILSAFPRALFSENELEAAKWFAERHGATGLPNVGQVKHQRERILNTAGLDVRTHEGGLGDRYSACTIERIIADEFRNPLVRPFVFTYAEDTRDTLSEARQAAKWLWEVDPNASGPMARSEQGKDYFVNEISMANLDSFGRIGPVMIRRWFMRKEELFARVNPLLIDMDERTAAAFDLPLGAFFLNAIDLQNTTVQRQYGLPSTANIAGVIYNEDPYAPLNGWPSPQINPWRERARGKRVLSLPLWLYCDDTSGNTSKKWNKHNSILLTLAGLPRKLAQLLYNIHFVSTSNIASPLEMMEYLVQTLRETRHNGIEVWDCLFGEDVLVVPWVLAFLGDNPMSSEFASHIGMSGRCYCRICRTHNAQDNPRECLDAFMKPGEPRTATDTRRDLEEQLNKALGGAPSSVDGLATLSGTKDNLQKAAKDVREGMKDVVREALQTLRRAMPDNLFNPTLLDVELNATHVIDTHMSPDFDPNQDSPFEALHVVLLGVVKYFWRDAVARQTADGKEILKARLTSVDVSGLDISPLRAQTLVQYAGSLVGRDFRAILQVAPTVLYGLIPSEAYEAWTALCRLAPLIFQPQIENTPDYFRRLEHSVYDFLAATALWTTQGFESYNFVIRLRSVHSNRHAPSKDIAQAFSFLHAVRHLVSGASLDKPRQAGDGVLSLLQDDVLVRLLGMEGLRKALSYTANVISCKSVLLASGDRVKVHDFVLWRPDSDAHHMHPRLAQVNEILVVLDTHAVLGILSTPCKIGEAVMPYRVPSVKRLTGEPPIPTSPMIVLTSNQDILCTANVVHNCAKHQCAVTRTKVIYQERHQTEFKDNEIHHLSDQDNLVLNLAQLRDAAVLQLLQPDVRYPGIEHALLLDEAVKPAQSPGISYTIGMHGNIPQPLPMNIDVAELAGPERHARTTAWESHYHDPSRTHTDTPSRSFVTTPHPPDSRSQLSHAPFGWTLQAQGDRR
ncbi:uncharacterized protein B0H18DRAFT_1085196 [Fomitopsis serialis]|uniref:uncharacterized protein n=1 Tax=Fomitopsis serialis TaxID=139415 RepID=UPI0020078EF8|nr:uncharacterized protein B0H18DRAFT_1085196 [Neoantrodia serialis]KAH9925773.1 hypothetical protein B0H18DRAFT_1085196 [Neoantrodia serialis]